MVCSKCGQELNDGVKFCTKCGAKCGVRLTDKKDYILPILAIVLSVIGAIGLPIISYRLYGNNRSSDPNVFMLLYKVRYLFTLLIYSGIVIALILQHKKKNILILIAGLIPCAYLIIPTFLRLVGSLMKINLLSSLFRYFQ